MKYCWFLFLFSLPVTCYSQNIFEINLSDSLNENCTGLWTKGDYKIYVEMSGLEKSFLNTAEGYKNLSLSTINQDTATLIINKITSDRYRYAANQLQGAENGFDLKKLTVYYGAENGSNGNSFIVEDYIKQLVEDGLAIVFYKDERTYKLSKQSISNGTGLDFGYNVQIYFDDVKNCVFNYYRHLGW